MPGTLTMSTLDDLNLDFSDRTWTGARRPHRAVEFQLSHDSDGDRSESDESADDLDLDDEYYFDHRLDFGLAGYVAKGVTENGGCVGVTGAIDDVTNTGNGKETNRVETREGQTDTQGHKERQTGAVPNGDTGDIVGVPKDQHEQAEKSSVLAIALEKLELSARRNDREEIRKKLAMGVDDDYYDDNDDDDDIRYKKPNLQSRLHSGLQICFMNESPCDTDSEGLSPRQLEIHDNLKAPSKDSEVDSDNNLRSVTDLNQVTSTSLAEGCGSVIPTAPVLKTSMVGVNSENFHSKQEQLQQEARMALAQAGSMAHMQLEIEKQAQKKSPMAEMVGIPGLGERRRKKLGIRKLQEMNLTSIQVLYNDLQTQIENLNEELVHLLMERDELHMEQDSMLVDIEDLTRRAEELAARKNYKDGKGNMKGKVSGR